MVRTRKRTPPREQALDNWARISFWSLAFAFLLALFNHGLVPSMEPRFAEVVREMIAAGEWVMPLKNGVPYVEYPVFYYWLAIIGKSLGLPMTAAIRLPTFLAFLGWLWLLGRWQRLVLPELPARVFQIAGAALPLVLFQFSIAQTDGLLVFGVMMSMFGYTQLALGRKDGFPWCLWGGVAIAFLAKGPVGIACTLPVMCIDRISAGWLAADGSDIGQIIRSVLTKLQMMAWTRGLAILLLVAVPWYVAAGLKSGWEFVEAVLIYQNFERYITGYSHPQPWWYYLKTLSYDFFPLSFVLPIGLWVARHQISTATVRFILIWALFTFLFFSASGSKQGKYLLPMAPAVIAIAFVGIEYLRDKYGHDLWRFVRPWCLSLICFFSILIIFVLPFYSLRIGGVDGFLPIKEQLAREPGRIVHFQWPRSLTLYELGAPMSFVRSARELYAMLAAGEIVPGDYVLVRSDLLESESSADPSLRLQPYPNDEFFEHVLTTKAEKSMVLLRVVPGAPATDLPETPDPPVLNWRDEMFDTD